MPSDGGYFQRRVVDLAARREQAFKNYLRQVDSARDRLERTLTDLDARSADLQAKSEDLVVLVRRTPGPKVTKYHSSSTPCGRVTGQARSRSSFQEWLEGEATASGLERCHACAWPASERETFTDEELRELGLDF